MFNRHPALRLAAWIAIYLAFAIGVVLVQPATGPAPWYPPVVIGIGLLTRCGLRWWPVILLLETPISLVQYDTSLVGAIVIAAATTLEEVVGWWLLQRLRPTLDTAQDVLTVGGVAGVTALVGSAVGTLLTMPVDGVGDHASRFVGWFSGDLIALATLLPTMLLGLQHQRGARILPTGRLPRLEIAAILLVGAGLVLLATLLGPRLPAPQPGILRYTWIFPVLWAAIRYDRVVTAVTVAVMAAAGFLALGIDPEAAVAFGTVSLQLVTVGLSLMGLAVSTTISGRRAATERLERALAALAESEQRYAQVFATSPALQWLVDPATSQIVDANEAAARFYGYTRKQLRQMRVTDIAISFTGAEVLETMARNALAPANIMVEHRIASGEVRTMEIHTGPVVLDSRTLLHSILRDATDEIAARAEVARLAAAVESAAESVVTTDLDGRITGWNPAAEALYGHPRDAVLGHHVDDLLGDLEMDRDQLRELVRKGGSIRFGQVVRRVAGGAVVPVDLTVSPIVEGGEVVGVSRISHDLRHALEGEDRLRRSEALLADAAEIGRMGSWELDLDTHRATWSDELYRIAGVPQDTPVTATSLRDLVHAEDQDRIVPLLEREEAGSAPLAFRLTCSDGRVRHVVASWRRIAGTAGSMGRRVGVLRDVTEERALEEQLRQAQRLESIGLLAGGVAHDFNNILTAVAGFTDLARYAVAAGENPDADLEQVQLAVARARSLTSQLLTFGRRAIVRPRPTDLAASVETLVPMLRRLLGERVSILTELAAGSIAVIDPGQLDQVVVNLAVNARDAMPEGGRLRISVGSNAGGEVQEGADRLVWLEVEDDGQGIPPDVMDQIFLPFFTTKERGQGTGLGLSTVLGIVAQAGGRIDVSSRPGEGSLFRVELPADLARPEVASRGEAPERLSGRGLVLFVEDEDLVRRMGERVLTAAGFRVLTAATMPDALAIADRERPDVLASDIVLPGVGDGIELAETLRARWPDLPVLLMTGYTERTPPEWATLLVKPYQAAELTAAVRDLAATTGPAARRAGGAGAGGTSRATRA